MSRLSAIVLGALLLVGTAATTAQAQFGFGPGGYGLGFYNYQYNQPRIPYYALYPPVYYSYPVARTYGYSPFAYPPGIMTPEAPRPTEAAEYRNPYVPSNKEPRPSVDLTASQPRTYHNPFVQARQAGADALAEQREGAAE
jgi:hypothetical protein